MKTEIGSYEAKTRLPELLREVGAGYAFTITKHGKPVADLVPSEPPISSEARALAIQALKKLMTDNPIRGVDIKELIDDGRA